jgi:MoaA/NifB/PqqE/SkfB family radical SAM enzyme
LTHADYVRLIGEAGDAGFSTIQFIGGEPFAYKGLPDLVCRAQRGSFDHVEVFTNLTIPRPDVLDIIDAKKTTVATSVYTNDPFVHDGITGKSGSFAHTLDGIRRLRELSIEVRAGFIEMESNLGHFERTEQLLNNLGVSSVGFDRVRGFGRGGNSSTPMMKDLCGTCAGDTLCISYDGSALPCIMSRAWPIGSVRTSSLADIMKSHRAREVRASILSCVSILDVAHMTGCEPSMPDCMPRCQPGCYPGQQCNPCGPGGAQPCYPNERCNPIGCGRMFIPNQKH